MAAKLFRVILPVDDLERADAFWDRMLGLPIDKAVPTRHYIDTGGAILVLVDPSEQARGHQNEPLAFRPNPEVLYFAVADLDAAFERAEGLGMRALHGHGVGTGIQTRPWGERSFYGLDPSGNPICFVDDQTLYTGSSRA